MNPQFYTGTIQAENRNFKQGIIQQFNLNVERQLPGNIVLTVGYGGSRTAHVLVGQFNENLIVSERMWRRSRLHVGCGFGFLPYPNRPVGDLPSGDTNNSIGAARYDSLQVKAETKSARHGLYALIGYTYSRNFDTGLTDGLGTNPGAFYYPLPGTKRLDWGLSQLNLNDSFTASILYDLPFGKGKRYGSNWSGVANTIFGHWQVNVIERATTGFPLFVVDSANEAGVDFSYNGDTFQRPNEVGNPNTGTCPNGFRVHTIECWFNTSAFAKAPAGELGTAPRAPVYGPRFVNTDFSIIKDFPLPREAMNLQFRAEFFNLLNHAQFFLNGFSDTGEQDISTPSSFGVINNTVNNPRLIQFALRLEFLEERSEMRPTRAAESFVGEFRSELLLGRSGRSLQLINKLLHFMSLALGFLGFFLRYLCVHLQFGMCFRWFSRMTVGLRQPKVRVLKTGIASIACRYAAIACEKSFCSE